MERLHQFGAQKFLRTTSRVPSTQQTQLCWLHIHASLPLKLPTPACVHTHSTAAFYYSAIILSLWVWPALVLPLSFRNGSSRCFFRRGGLPKDSSTRCSRLTTSSCGSRQAASPCRSTPPPPVPRPSDDGPCADAGAAVLPRAARLLINELPGCCCCCWSSGALAA